MKSLLCCLLVTLFVCNLDASRFRCDYTFSKEAGGYLKYMEIPDNWIDARAKCALEGATLASPLTPELRKGMIKVANSTCHGMWTGLHKQFRGAYYASVEGVPLRNIPHSWINCEPDDEKNEESCLLMDSKGDLADARCSETLPYVCYKKTVPGMVMSGCGTSDIGYNFEKQTGKCYKLHKEPTIWSQAYITCMAEGGHLVIINSEVEKNVVSALYKNNLTPAQRKDQYIVTFIGMQKWNETGEWRTVHGETLEEAGYAGWGKGEPNNPDLLFCGTMFQNGELDDSSCNYKTSFICEKDPEALMCDHERK
ncbi:lectin c-type domain-containing protein [Phthorimaea operculella]|nr:lectin c-type domain-containing protein [Phthorimaea operculella]